MVARLEHDAVHAVLEHVGKPSRVRGEYGKPESSGLEKHVRHAVVERRDGDEVARGERREQLPSIKEREPRRRDAIAELVDLPGDLLVDLSDHEDVEAIRNRTAELGVAMQKVGQAMYEADGAAGDGEAGPRAEGDDVAEGEYKVD